MRFDEKLMILRKHKGMSQEQLADHLGVTRQSVSKWESGLALPELAKIITMSEMFDVSVDYLVKDYIEEDRAASIENDDSHRQAEYGNSELEAKVDEIRSYMKGYQFTSKTKICGIPLVSIKLSRRLGGKDSVAKGIIAIGNISVGIISIGLLSVGVFSLGCIAAGLLAIGAMAVGIAALGAVAAGIAAFGTVAVGIYAGGVAVYGAQIAAGVAAKGHTVIGESINGVNQLKYYEGIPADVIREFLMEHHPKLWNPLRELFVALGTAIK